MAQHDVFNPAGTPGSVFPNDLSSNNALEKRAQTEAAEAARKKKVADEAAELERLRTQYPTLEAQNKALEAQKSALESQKASLETQKASLETQKATLETQKSALEGLNATLQSQKTQRDTDVANLERQMADIKRLDPLYHEREVRIILACWPHTALDMGGNNGAYPHGWEYNAGCSWQRLRLRRVDVNEASSPWTISHWTEDLYLGVSDSPDRKVENQRGRRWDGEFKRRQEWFIALNSSRTGYLIESVPHAWLDMVDPAQNRNDKALRNVAKAETWDGQIWHIILK